MASIWDTAGMNTTPAAPSGPMTPTQFSGQTNPFYNGGQYGQTQDWVNTPVSENMREQNQRLAFNYYGNQQGIPENDSAFSRWFYETQFPRFQSAQGMALMNNPMLTVDQFISTLPGMDRLRAQFQALSPQARGAQYSVYGPNVRWINR